MSKIRTQIASSKFLIAFCAKSSIIFVLWLVFYQSSFVDTSFIDDFLIQQLITSSIWVLNGMNYLTFHTGNHVGVMESSGVIIGPPCNAFSLFVLYAGFIIAFPGQWQKKMIAVPIGILLIHLLNLLRVLALILLSKHHPEALQFNHSYTFTLIVYVSIFLMWMFWINQNRKFTKRRS